MPLVITPAQLQQRAEMYHQLGQLATAGIGLIPALELVHRNPPHRSMREPLGRVIAQLQQGSTFGESLPHSGTWLPAFDIALLRAGEHSGRLPDSFRLLSGHYHERAQLARQVIAFTAYPLFVFHLAVLIFPLSRLTGLILRGEIVGFALQKLAVLAPVYGVAVFVAFATQGHRGEQWRAWLETIFRRVPILCVARRNLAIARLAAALEALLNAGVTVIEAWDMAAAASGSPAIERAVREERANLVAGMTPAEMVRRRREFPQLFANLYATGELSGQLDDALRRSRVLFQEEGSRKLRNFVFATAGMLVMTVMLGVAWQIISFYLGYFRQIEEAIPK